MHSSDQESTVDFELYGRFLAEVVIYGSFLTNSQISTVDFDLYGRFMVAIQRLHFRDKKRTKNQENSTNPID